MANLIITVIAIALVAVASLMGAYYGGSAFLNNQSAANASTVLNQGQQIAGAWDAYLGDNLNTAPTAWAALITNNYLAQVPQAPAEANGVTTTAFYIVKNGSHYYAYADMGKPTTSGSPSATDTAAAACVRIAKTATGVAPATMAATALGSISAQGTYGNGTFGCTASSAAPSYAAFTGNGTAPAAGDYTMEYLIQ